ncbi:MAG: methyltransferase domain-containing protein [Bacteroidota bacterium]
MSNKFSNRSSELELLDAPNIPAELLFQNLKELDLINQTLGGHIVTLAGIKKLLTDKNKIYHIVDIGCGGGDAMKMIAEWAKKNNYKVKLTGVDFNNDAINYMKIYGKDYPEINGVNNDYREFLKTDDTIDIIHCSLFCHHLKDDELIELFTCIKQSAKIGFVINDLHRHWFAYYSIKFLTRLLNGSSLVRNDAPLSVLRGFKNTELKKILEKAEIKNADIKWMWAFRYLIIYRNGKYARHQ